VKVPLSWLADYADLTLPVDDLAHRLSMAGAEVESIDRTGGDWGDTVCVGLVTALEPHPNADRLRLATVDYGGDAPQTVVCGAPNVALGQKIAFALEGAELIDAHAGGTRRLKKSKIRGVESAGMVCSERELGLSDEHEGILVLDDALTVGAPIADILGDTILDIAPTPNRSDHFSVLGIAREVAALTAQTVREPALDYLQDGPPIAETTAAQANLVEIADPDLCPRYVATIIRGIQVRPSPDWLQTRLIAAGQRPINNVVDVTNFVMLEMGQPLHAFDYDRLAEGRIIVRRPRPGERITLLDGSDQKLAPNHLLIADANTGVALAGVMGGAHSEVTPQTTNVLLEAANFTGANTRRTAAALKQRTEASLRFEKGLNPELAAQASARAMRLLLQTGGGTADTGIVDAYPGKQPRARVQLTAQRLAQIAGVDLPTETVRSILSGLGFPTQWKPPSTFIAEVPPWRTDIAIPDDLVEEVLRVYGYDNLPSRSLSGAMPEPTIDPRLRLRETARDALAALGCAEVITYSATTAAAQNALCALGTSRVWAIPLLNPMSSQHDHMRTSLRPGVLASYAANARSRSRLDGPLQLFEAGKVFLPLGAAPLDAAAAPSDETESEAAAGLTDGGGLPLERLELVLAIGGAPAPSPHDPAEPPPLDLFHIKALLDSLATTLRLPFEYAAPQPQAPQANQPSDPALLPGVCAIVSVVQGAGKKARRTPVGVVGQLDPVVAQRFDIDGPLFLAELDIDALAKLEPQPISSSTLSRYPAVTEDLAIVVAADVPAAHIAAILTRNALIERADLFDTYTGPQVAAGKKSLAYAIAYRAPDRTLTDADVLKLRGSIIKQLQRELQATIREG